MKMKGLDKESIILGLAIIILLLFGYLIYSHYSIPEVDIESFNKGVWATAYEQTTKGVFFFIDENNNIQNNDLNTICEMLK